jgi:hypothetical protein
VVKVEEKENSEMEEKVVELVQERVVEAEVEALVLKMKNNCLDKTLLIWI